MDNHLESGLMGAAAQIRPAAGKQCWGLGRQGGAHVLAPNRRCMAHNALTPAGIPEESTAAGPAGARQGKRGAAAAADAAGEVRQKRKYVRKKGVGAPAKATGARGLCWGGGWQGAPEHKHVCKEGVGMEAKAPGAAASCMCVAGERGVGGGWRRICRRNRQLSHCAFVTIPHAPPSLLPPPHTCTRHLGCTGTGGAAAGAEAVGRPPTGAVDSSEPLYCTCQNVSYGEMIMCENESCDIEWFHVGCVGVTLPHKGKWYCSPACEAAGKAKGH